MSNIDHLDTAPAAPVQLRNVVRQFGQQRVIDGLDLDIAPGEFVALLGASGSGKTTLLRSLAGLDSIDSGQLRVPSARAAVFQEPRLMPWKRAWKNVVLGLRVPDAKARAVQALTEVGLAHRIDAYPATLSGGEAQRVALARGLVREPKLLLLDEPFAALDALTRIRMHRLIIELWRKHTPAVLLVTHDVDEAILLADRVIVLADGKIAEQLTIDLPRARDTGQPGFQAIRARLLTLLGVEVEPAAVGEHEIQPGLAESKLKTAKHQNADARVQLQADIGVSHGQAGRAVGSIERAGSSTLSVISAK